MFIGFEWKDGMEIGTYWNIEASPPASRMPFNSASACDYVVSDLMSQRYQGTRSRSTYQLLDVAVHGVVYNCDLGSHLERIDVKLGYQTGNRKFNWRWDRLEMKESKSARRGSSPTLYILQLDLPIPNHTPQGQEAPRPNNAERAPSRKTL
jgi:hypothetical protein